ncbi:MAG: GDP-mannose 4,6-dehydratase [Candidatus Yanofskybacteria bacterium CG10_big_fil_rev_8_21_14_0_10_36_16]|uniref:GDP-mannose 4,6-dehydratase n=1 Tax=Candidatus Yanofskybacteria bacterium CG10_big_fil_rev_8_21_14_0_10_36_16 TaxID=1975096 RepID=A0A2J0Q7I4_9BACT|nr:MAG: GDP-mannose 4,6-dehydratase [Candidatus Yanofskybacteria bacterium CG10_big_fil_rev_8_21_14_0_10_36_16]
MKNTKNVLIMGVFGQDGSYLAEFLLDKDYKVFGFDQKKPSQKSAYLNRLAKKIIFIKGDLKNQKDIEKAVEKSQPDEVYNLAGVSDLTTAKNNPKLTMDLNYRSVGYLVKNVFSVNPKARIFQAGSSQMFCEKSGSINEKSSMCNRNNYAKAKIKAHKEFIINYRKQNYYICSGFLFNHESPRRDKRFVTTKIVESLKQIKKTGKGILELGNLNSKKDWGFAGDYVKAMWLMLQQPQPDDYVIATGKLHSVRDFVEISAKVLNIKLNWQGGGINEVGLDNHKNVVVKINRKYYRENELPIVANIKKINKKLGWKPQTNLSSLIKMMIG